MKLSAGLQILQARAVLSCGGVRGITFRKKPGDSGAEGMGRENRRKTKEKVKRTENPRLDEVYGEIEEHAGRKAVKSGQVGSQR